MAVAGRTRVHSSLEHISKDRVKMTAEPGGGEERCSAATLPLQLGHVGGRRKAILALPSLHCEVSPHSSSKELGCKGGDVTKGLRKEVACLCTASTFTEMLVLASEQFGPG